MRDKKLPNARRPRDHPAGEGLRLRVMNLVGKTALQPAIVISLEGKIIGGPVNQILELEGILGGPSQSYDLVIVSGGFSNIKFVPGQVGLRVLIPRPG